MGFSYIGSCRIKTKSQLSPGRQPLIKAPEPTNNTPRGDLTRPPRVYFSHNSIKPDIVESIKANVAVVLYN